MPLSTPWLLLLLCLALLGLAVVAWLRAAGRVRRGNLARQRVASAGEVEAEQVLARAGFTIVDRQVTGRWCLWIDGEPHEVSSRADLLVHRHGRRFVAEVKTGEHAPDPRHPATRRQLLEYHLAFPVHGVLLVDMEARRIHRVDFPGPDPPD
jgi:Holliday junction resolvase-like predicted endonuclease